METEALAMAQEIDFSLLALFARATFTVKVVMIGLIVMSFWSWAIIIQKHIAYRVARREATIFDRAFWSGEPLDELFERLGPQPDGASEKIFASGMLEWRRSHRQDGGLIAGAQSRIDRSMDVAIAARREGLNKGLSFPGHHRVGRAVHRAVRHGLGDQARLRADRDAQNTNLAVVAPGIAEALLATGLGLLAAIPAVVFYNKLTATASRSYRATRHSPTSSPRSCRASWTRPEMGA
jgi:biopolymer transport protein TolQ